MANNVYNTLNMIMNMIMSDNLEAQAIPWERFTYSLGQISTSG